MVKFYVPTWTLFAGPVTYGHLVDVVAMVTGEETGWSDPKGNGATDGIV